jgi:hypothetical protein
MEKAVSINESIPLLETPKKRRCDIAFWLIAILLGFAGVFVLVYIFFIPPCKTPTVISNLLTPRSGTSMQWSAYIMADHHSTRGPVQLPSQWTNITIDVPDGAATAQLTAYPPSNNMNDNLVGYWAKIAYFNVSCNQLNVSVVYWDRPWTLYVGWYIQTLF